MPPLVLPLSLSQPSAQGSLTATGAYCPVIDKPEQALDLLQEAIRSAGMQLNQDVGVMVDIGADKLYDQVSHVAAAYMNLTYLCTYVHTTGI